MLSSLGEDADEPISRIRKEILVWGLVIARKAGKKVVLNQNQKGILRESQLQISN